jgi:hypothetical protein
LSSSRSYIELAKKYPNLPKSYLWLITLLWGNYKCLEWWYVKALIQWNWDLYFNNREIENNKKIKNKQEFIDFFNQLSDTDKNMILNYNSYIELAKKYPNLPKSYRWLITLLWGNNKCTEWWYAKALIQWNWDLYFNNREMERSKKD